MEVAKLTEVGLSGVKTITKNPDIKDIKMAYYAAASPYRGIFEKPKVWDGSKDIVDLSRGVGIPKETEPFKAGGMKSYLEYFQQVGIDISEKIKPVTEDIRPVHCFPESGIKKLWDGSKDISELNKSEHITPRLPQRNEIPDNYIVMPDSLSQMATNLPKDTVVKMMPTLPDAKTEWGYNPSPEMEAVADRLKSFFERLAQERKNSLN